MLPNPPRPSHKLRIESACVGLAWGLPQAAVVHASLTLRSCRRAQLARHLRPTLSPPRLAVATAARRVVAGLSVRPSPRRRFCRFMRAVAGAAALQACCRVLQHGARRAVLAQGMGAAVRRVASKSRRARYAVCRCAAPSESRVGCARACANYGCWAVCLRVRDAGRLWPAAAVCPSPAPACWLVQLARVAEVACRA